MRLDVPMDNLAHMEEMYALCELDGDLQLE